jgi:hypothetical protein
MEHWIGIDVSSATLDFALLDGKGTHLESVQIENDRKAVMYFCKSLSPANVTEGRVPFYDISGCVKVRELGEDGKVSF